MEFFRIKNDIPFMRHALTFNIISFVTFILAVVFLFTKGLHLSVEFTGGTLVEVSYKDAANVEAIRDTLDKAGLKGEVQNFGSSRDVLIRLPVEKGQSTADISNGLCSGDGGERRHTDLGLVGPVREQGLQLLGRTHAGRGPDHAGSEQILGQPDPQRMSRIRRAPRATTPWCCPSRCRAWPCALCRRRGARPGSRARGCCRRPSCPTAPGPSTAWP